MNKIFFTVTDDGGYTPVLCIIERNKPEIKFPEILSFVRIGWGRFRAIRFGCSCWVRLVKNEMGLLSIRKERITYGCHQQDLKAL